MPLLSLPRRFLDWLFGPPVDPELAEIIAWSIDQVEPRLRQISGYPRRYAPPIANAWAYCRDLAAQVAGPVVVDRQAFGHDPVVHALFCSPEGIVQALVKSRAMRDWQQRADQGREVFALMGVRRWEKDILGMEDSDGMLRRDVSQKAVYFSNHTFSNLGATEEDTRELLTRQFMASLLSRVTDRVEELRQARQRLEQDRDELRARLRASLGNEELQAELKQTLAALSACVASLDLLGYAGHFQEVLMLPQQYLSLHSVSLSLDTMGIQREAEEGSQVRQLDLQQLSARDRRRWIVMLVRCRLDELPPYQERLADAEHWLSI